MAAFPTEIVISASSDICNLEKEAAELFQLACAGKRVVIYGRRNTGKTSLLTAVIFPQFKKKHNQKAVCVFVDFLGVSSRVDAQARMQRGLELALAKSFPVKAMLKNLATSLKNLRPQVSVDPITGEPSVSLSSDLPLKDDHLDILVREISYIHSSYPVLIVLDEFQEVTQIKNLAALFRTSLQFLPQDLPVFVCGSKKHLLSSMFGRHRAPFASWGEDLEIPTVLGNLKYQDKYFNYASSRLKPIGIELGREVFDFIIQQCDGIPEPINIVLEEIASGGQGRKWMY